MATVGILGAGCLALEALGVLGGGNVPGTPEGFVIGRLDLVDADDEVDFLVAKNG